MFGKIWYNPRKVDECIVFVLILDDLDETDGSDIPYNTAFGDELDVAGKLYQANRNQYPSLTM